jgi:hypothetical protein
VDDQARADWRERLEQTYPWVCSCCKTRYVDQAKLETRLLRERHTEVVRHSECGHVLMWRAGAAQWPRHYPRPTWASASAVIQPHERRAPPPPRTRIRRRKHD